MTGESDSTTHRHPTAVPVPWRPCTCPWRAGTPHRGCHVATLVGGNQFAALRFVQILPIVKPFFHGLSDGFPFADLVLFEIGCGRRQSSIGKNQPARLRISIILCFPDLPCCSLCPLSYPDYELQYLALSDNHERTP